MKYKILSYLVLAAFGFAQPTFADDKAGNSQVDFDVVGLGYQLECSNILKTTPTLTLALMEWTSGLITGINFGRARDSAIDSRINKPLVDDPDVLWGRERAWCMKHPHDRFGVAALAAIYPQ